MQHRSRLEPSRILILKLTYQGYLVPVCRHESAKQAEHVRLCLGFRKRFGDCGFRYPIEKMALDHHTALLFPPTVFVIVWSLLTAAAFRSQRRSVSNGLRSRFRGKPQTLNPGTVRLAERLVRVASLLALVGVCLASA